MKFGPELSRRLQAAHDRKALIAAEGEQYHYMVGEYRTPTYDGEVVPQRPELNDLYGVEQALYFTLIQIFQANRQCEVERSTILLDVRGMAGLSMVRIASRPSILQKIESGKIMIVVSNLGFDMRQEVQKSSSERLNFLTAAEALYVLTKRYLVHYIQGDAQTLLRTSITTRTGQDIPLRGNVDLVHEHLALAHGQKSDLDIPRLGKLVSPVGELWLNTTEHNLMTGVDAATTESAEHYAARKIGHRFGVENLAELGLQPRPQAYNFGYQIFRHS